MKKYTIKQIKKQSTITNNVFAISTYFSPYVTKLFLYTPITANQISFLSFLFIFIPAPMIAFGNYWIVLIGALLLQVPIILDYSDGAVARIKGTQDGFGNCYTGYLHIFIPIFIVFSLSINSYRHFNNYLFLILGTIAIIFMCLTDYSRRVKDSVALKYQLNHSRILKKPQDLSILSSERKVKNKYLFNIESKGRFNSLTNFIYVFNSFSHLMGIMFLLALFDVIHYAIIFYTTFYILIAIVKVSIELKKGMKEFVFERIKEVKK